MVEHRTLLYKGTCEGKCSDDGMQVRCIYILYRVPSGHQTQYLAASALYLTLLKKKNIGVNKSYINICLCPGSVGGP